MKRKLTLVKAGNIIYSGLHEISDAASFGHACKEAWDNLQRQRFERASNVGELMESLSEDILAELDGSTFHIEEN